jgi:hypothetical protein
MAADPDRYEAWYSDKLWNLLPELYRVGDFDDNVDRKGPLRELVERIGAQAAIVRRSIDRLWEDQSIETCDDWVIDYLGDLLATNLVASLDARGRRIDVGKTIYYRRRKGTVGLLEELATDITGWSVRVVECFHRLSRTRHGLDPAIGLPAAAGDPRWKLQRAQRLVGALTSTGAGGYADLRNVHGANLARTAFDEFFYTADMRRGRGKTGWPNIPRLAVFTWRLKSYPLLQVTPVRDSACTNQYTFDPTGRDLPLFAAGEHLHGDQWVSPGEYEVPGPISPDLLEGTFLDLYGDDDEPRSLRVHKFVGGAFDPYDLVHAAQVSQDRRQSTGLLWIDPSRGRIIEKKGSDIGPFRVDYHYGFSSEIGAGAYVRRVQEFERPETCPPPAPVERITGGEAELVTPPPPGPAPVPSPLRLPITIGTISIDDSLTYHAVADLPAVQSVVLRAKSMERPLIRPTPVADWVFTGAAGGAVLVLDGLFVSGVNIVLRGSFDRVTLSCCTLDPGHWDKEKPEVPATATTRRIPAVPAQWGVAADRRKLKASQLLIEGSVRHLVIDRSITGPILDSRGELASLIVRDSIVQSTEPLVPALNMVSGEAALERATILGALQLHRVDVSECILHDVATIDDTQHGCVRFSAWAAGSVLPRRYESVSIQPHAGLFTDLDFGAPGFAQLLATASGAISAGAENGAEMGAFAREKSAIKERSLLIKYQEYLPLGLEPVIVHVT